ncbi:MAG: hypothetical protein ACK5NY_06690 [Burkholderiaceae bacterium]
MRRVGMLSLAANAMTAQALPPGMDTQLSLRTTVYSGDRNLNDRGPIGTAEVWAKLRWKNPFGTLVVNAAPPVSTPAQRQPADRLRELYLRQTIGPLDLTYGRQVIAWGKTDGLNPSDVVSPRTFTRLSVSDDDLRRGRDGMLLKTAWAIAGQPTVLSAALLDGRASHVIPVPTVAGIDLSTRRGPARLDVALKWETSFPSARIGATDASLMFYRGVDLMPDLAISQLTPFGASLLLRNHRQQVIAADANVVRGTVVWRAEAAYARPDDGDENDFTRKKPTLWVVAGPEFRLNEKTTLGVQVTARYVRHFSSADALRGLSGNPLFDEAYVQAARTQQAIADQSHAVRRGFTWRLASSWLDDRLTGELGGAAIWPDASGIARLKLSYAVTDEWRLEAGAEKFYGPDNTYFGFLRKNSLLYVQSRYSL